MRRELSAVSPEPSRARAGGEDRSTAVSIALCACQQCLPARFIYSALWVLSLLKPPPPPPPGLVFVWFVFLFPFVLLVGMAPLSLLR